MSWTMRRTGFIERVVGVGPMHPMWPARAGGTITCYATTVTFKQDQTVKRLLLHNLDTRGFSAANQPRWVVSEGKGKALVGDPVQKQGTGLDRVAPGKTSFRIAPGGYLAVLGSGESNNGMVFNTSRQVLVARASPWGWYLEADLHDQPVKAGQRFTSNVTVVLDALDQSDRTTERVEKVRRYLGLTGENGCAAKVQRGRLVSQDGVLTLAGERGVVDLELPNPGWKVALPLGLRFVGFNPNWTVGQLQCRGYMPSFHRRPAIVYRNLGLDDEGVGFLALYPDQSSCTQVSVGHPVQCRERDLIIEVAMLSDSPPWYHVAVNNPTSRPIRTVLTKTLDLPGFTFPDTPVEVPPGGYLEIRSTGS
jgi:hypothetical protein